jgi:hypothetical protein
MPGSAGIDSGIRCVSAERVKSASIRAMAQSTQRPSITRPIRRSCTIEPSNSSLDRDVAKADCRQDAKITLFSD